MTSKLMKFLTTLLCLACVVPAFAFKDIRVDLTNGNLLTADEKSNQTLTTFGVAIGDDGSATRVAADNPTAAIVLTGKYHSDQHGWGNFSSTVKVEGPVKISMGTCNWGGDVTVKDETGAEVGKFNTNTGDGCYSTSNPLTAYCYYTGGAATLTIAGGSYTPYIAVEAAEVVPNEATITYSLGEYEGAGIAPLSEKVLAGKEVTIPVNTTIYVEGKTLKGWTDGTTTYAIGDKLTLDKDVTLTPVFADNTVSLADRTGEISLKFDFEPQHGATKIGVQGKTGVWVAQAVVNGETIDVKMDIDATSGKFAHGSWVDWVQINGGTKLTVPSCKGATIGLKSWGKTTTTTINGDVIDQDTTEPVYTVTADGATAEIVIGDGSYWGNVSVVLPVVQADDPVVTEFKDIRINLLKGNMLTADEKASKDWVTFGVAIADDGAATRVAADDPTAAIVLTGKYHSDDHGWGNFSSTAKVNGPVKISMGTCNWGGDVTVKDETGAEVGKFNTNTGEGCYSDANPTVASCYYNGGATTLTISGGSYTPYIAVEAVEDVPTEATVTYSLGEYEGAGIVPASEKVLAGKEVTIPVNTTIYVEGKTLTGWTDGANTYAVGDKVALTKDVTLTPVFTDNTVALSDRKDEVTVKFDFEPQHGATKIGLQGNTGIWVAQAVVNGETIDVKMDIDATSGKFAHGSWVDWVQINGGTKLTVPSCKGATIGLKSFSATTTTTIDGEVINQGTQTPSFTIGGDSETVDIVIGDGSYWGYVSVILPYVKPVAAGTEYTNEPASVVWPFNNDKTYEEAVATPEIGFSVTAVELNGASLKGTEAAKATTAADKGVVFIKVQPKNGASDVVEWSLKTAKGLTFTPTKVRGYITRFGTDAENGVTVSVKAGDGSAIQLGTFTARRNTKTVADDIFGSKGVDEFDIELTADQQAQLASADGFTLMATVGVGNAKQGGFSEMTVEGLLNGKIADVAKYTVTAKAEPAEAATVTLYPKSETYDQGSTVKVSAEKNFGYAFVNWTDATGKVVSEEPEFVLEVTENTELTANYEKLVTYELSWGVDGGANDYMVQAVPAPTEIDGKNMYEAGTTVKLTAMSNKILTFTNWSDGQSSSEISVVMDADKAFVANYSAIDYVAAWDFYLPGTGRAADFYSADNDIATLVLRNANGDVEGWLDKSEVAAGGYEGRPGAVNWRTTGLGDFYWQTKVNASAFTNLQVVTAMLYNYNAYTKQDVEYSLDGENWTKIGTITIEGRKNWTDATFDLPAAANNQAEVYIRIISDKTSSVDGTTSNNDGIALGATYILGTEQLVNDGKAPVLVSYVPEEGSATASINGKVVLTFDEKVKVKDGVTATLNDIELTPSVSGKTVMFQYKNLAYGTDYKFSLAGNSISDLTDNYLTDAIVINFTTKTRPAVAKALYDFIVPTDGTLEEALAAAAKRADTSARYRIFVQNGDYVLPASKTATKTGSDGKSYPDPTTYVSTPNVSIIGESTDGVVITNDVTKVENNGGNVLEGIGNGDVLRLEKGATELYFQNLTMKSAMGDRRGRDIVLNDNSNKTVMKDVCLWGYQDTYVSNNDKGRFYFEGGVLRGRTDFLCGKGDVFYNAVTLQMVGSGYLAVPSVAKKYGYVFRDCEIVGEPDKTDGNKTPDGSYTLGRPWGSGTPIALFIDTKMTAVPAAIGWSEMSGGYPARFAEYNSTTESGSVIDLASRKKTFGDNHANNPVLTKEEADAMTIATVMGDEDDWDPAALAEQAPAPANVTIDGTQLTWDNSDYALLWAVVKNGKVVDFTTEPSYTVDDPQASYAVRAANEMGGLGEPVVANSMSSGIDSVDAGVVVVSTVYYNVEGVQVTPEYKGWVIKVDTLSDGQTVATKTMNK